MPSSAKFRIDLEPSRQLALLLGSGHSLAIVAAWCGLSGWPLYLAEAGIAVSGVATVANALHRSAGAVAGLELDASGRAAWRDRRGRWHEAELGADHFVSNWLVAVCLVAPVLRRKWVLVLRDSASAEQFRRLRVWLRWHRRPTSGNAEKSTAQD